MIPPDPAHYTREDFVRGHDIRWCPGCGNYAVLTVMQKTLAQLGIPRENHVFVAGIGCSSRQCHYVNTYGFHTIHGRAPAIATGLKCVRPDLTVWVITGDGDGLSIGTNHLIHCMRRNVDLNIILMNNRTYGLTTGQYSPTSEMGMVTKSSPYGTIENPLHPLCVAIAAEATFIARTFDTDPQHMGQILTRAARHKGVSFVEVYQNCLVFNKDAFAPVVSRENREEGALYLEDGKPLIFGKQKDKGIILNGLKTEVIDLNKATAEQKKKLLIHKENDPSPAYAYLLTQMEYPELPVCFGVFRSIEKPTYDQLLDQQQKMVIEKHGKGKLQDIIYNEDVWTVPGRK